MAVDQGRWGGERWERIAPLAGVVAVVLWAVGTALVVTDRPNGASPEEALAYYQDNGGRILVGSWLFMLGGFVFFWFLGSLRARLAAVEGANRRLTTIATAGGIAATLGLLLVPAGDATVAFRNDDLVASTADAFLYVGDAFFGAAEIALAALTAATGLLALRTGVLPRWLGIASLVLALWLLILPIGWLGMLTGFPLWTLIVSFLLWSRPAVVATPVAPQTPVS